MRPGSSTIALNKKSAISLFFVFLGFTWNDVVNYTVPTPLGSSIMLADIFFFLSLYFAARQLPLFSQHKGFLFFLGMLLLYTLIGVGRFGMTAVSDCRQFYHFFFFFLGLAYARDLGEENFMEGLYKIILSLAIGSFLLFLVEIIIGHGFGLAIMSSEETDYGFLEDERGIRILGSTETFNLCLFVIYVYIFKQSRSIIQLFLAAVFFIAVLVSQNRTPIIGACFGLFFLSAVTFRLKKGRMHVLLLHFLLVLLLFLSIYLLDYYKILPLLSSLRSATSIENDEIGTSSFRLLGALSALEVFFRHILLGEGLGPGWNIDFGFAVLNIQPHNQYVSILAKLGLIGFLLFIVWMVKCARIIKKYRRMVGYNQDLVRFATVLFASQIPYGLGFNFHPFFPFFFGMLFTKMVIVRQKNEENSYSYSYV